MKRFLLTIVVGMLTAIGLWAQTEWTVPEDGVFNGSTNFEVQVKVNGVKATSGVTVGAFINYECRGVGQVTSEKLLLVVQGNTVGTTDVEDEMGEIITFSVKYNDKVYDLKKTGTFDGEYHKIEFEIYDITEVVIPEKLVMENNTTVDFLSQISFKYGTDGSLKYSELPFNVAIELEDAPEDYAEIDYVSDDDGNLTAIKFTAKSVTSASGVSFSVWNSITEESTEVVLVVYDAITAISFKGAILIDKSGKETATVDLMKELTFSMGADLTGVSASELPLENIDIVWSLPTESSDYLSISGNTLTAKKGTNNGKYTLTAALKDKSTVSASTSVEVYVELTGITVAPTAVQVPLGESVDLNLTIAPADATYDPERIYCQIVPVVAQDLMPAVAELSADGMAITVSGRTLGAFTATVEKAIPDGGSQSVGTFTGEVGAVYDYAAGWNWISLPSVTDAMKTPAGLNTVAFEEAILDLRSQKASAYNDADEGFFGSLTEITNGAYRVKTTAATRAVVYGGDRGAFGKALTSSDPVSTLSMYAGWTWLYYPYSVKVDVAGLNGIMANNATWTDGDKIIGLNGSVEWNTDKFVGAGFFFEPGASYLVYRAAAGTLSWIPECQVNAYEAPAMEGGEPGTTLSRSMTLWSYDSHRFANNMVIVAKFEYNAKMELGAFVGDECRGEGKLVEHNGENYYFITVHGQAGELVNFKIFDGMDYSDLNTTMQFKGMAGSLTDPVMLSGDYTSGINTIASDNDSEEQLIDLNGRVADAGAHGIFVVRKNGVARKVVK